MYSISLRGPPSLLSPLLSPLLSFLLSFLSLSREEEEEREKRNAENVGTKGTEKVPAQEDEGEGDEGAKRGCSLSTPLALAIPGYTRCKALHHPYFGSVGSYGLCDGETKGEAERPYTVSSARRSPANEPRGGIRAGGRAG